MSELLTALSALSPVEWSTVPTTESELDGYLAELFSKTHFIINSIPIPEPDESTTRSRSHTVSSIASNASEISLSSARSQPAPPEHEKFQKDWGKPLKIKAAENPLGVSVYKMSAKDGKGAWFARRSVHEGIGFAKFQKSLEMEFPESLAVQGAPGEGNVRGIGGDQQVEDIKVPNRGRVEVYRLSAQFPGPTSPRDFATFLVTSSKAMKEEKSAVENSATGLASRHYMIISKPCDHPETQPRSGFVRGSYESVEFIREVPRNSNASQSSDNVNGEGEGGTTDNGKHAQEKQNGYDPEENPVEWIMVTRSEPGGGIPRFMVERGTPSSICADAGKFLDWACKNDYNENNSKDDVKVEKTKPVNTRRESLQSLKARGLAGVEQQDNDTTPASNGTTETQQETTNGGIWGAVTGAASTLKPFTPQVVLDRLPQQENQSQTTTISQTPQNTEHVAVDHTREPDAMSTMSGTSFASADSHLTSSSEDDGVSIASPASDKNLSYHEKEIRKLARRKEELAEKLAISRSKLEAEHAKQISKDESTVSKATAKHEKEVKKLETKYERNLRKLNEKEQKEHRKQEHKKRKQLDKDEKSKLMRERDEARQDLDVAKKEADTLRSLVEELQKENTGLVVQLGKLGVSPSDKDVASIHSNTSGSRPRSVSKVAPSIKSVMSG